MHIKSSSQCNSHSEVGASVVEYSLILGFITCALITGIQSFTEITISKFDGMMISLELIENGGGSHSSGETVTNHCPKKFSSCKVEDPGNSGQSGRP